METDAERQLKLIADTRARAAERLVTPWWYHLSLGALMSALVLAVGLGFGTWWCVVVVVLVLVGEGIVVGAYRRAMGVWTTAWEVFPRGAVWIAFGVGLALVGAAATVKLWTVLVWPVWALAAGMFVFMIVLGRLTDVAWRRRLSSAAA